MSQLDYDALRQYAMENVPGLLLVTVNGVHLHGFPSPDGDCAGFARGEWRDYQKVSDRTSRKPGLGKTVRGPAPRPNPVPNRMDVNDFLVRLRLGARTPGDTKAGR